jgi:uncharacterized RDD family membrane protein YckC
MAGFWGRRIVALLIDALFITLFLWAITAAFYPIIAWTKTYYILNFWPILLGLIILLYFTLLEGKWATTLGKGALKLRVEARDGNLNYSKAFLRNLSKFLWVPLILDVIIGFSVSSRGSRQLYLDKLAGTEVDKVR